MSHEVEQTFTLYFDGCINIPFEQGYDETGGHINYEPLIVHKNSSEAKVAQINTQISLNDLTDFVTIDEYNHQNGSK